jgi:hypothetical protein
MLMMFGTQVAPLEKTLASVQSLYKLLATREFAPDNLRPAWLIDLLAVPLDLDILDLNHALYRCNSEEATSEHRCYLYLACLLNHTLADEGMGSGDGCYTVPGYGQLKFVGLSGLVPLLEDIVAANDLGHALCDNVRQGSWLLGFLAQHMNKYDTSTMDLGIPFLTALL